MLFYCPNCQKEVEAQETGTVTTKSGRVAHKAPCPTCGQDMTEFVPGEKVTPPVDTSAPAAGVPQPSVETAAGVPQPSMETAAAPAPAAPVAPVAPAVPSVSVAPVAPAAPEVKPTV
jgi:pyruvate dehydrogenase E2 component (dihydrolipoamide acetyltransferase)